MAGADTIIWKLREMGAIVFLRDGRPVCRAPKGALPAELLESYKARKPEILSALKEEDRYLRTWAGFHQRLVGSLRAVHGPAWDARVDRLEGLGLTKGTAEECAFLELLEEETHPKRFQAVPVDPSPTPKET